MFQSSPNPLNRPLNWALPLLLLAGALSLQLAGLNRVLFHLINFDLGRLLDPSLWASITILGDGLMGITLLLILHHHYPKFTYTALIAGILAGLWVHLLKNAMAMPRPPAVLDAQSINIIGHELHHGSFPSGHASTLFALLGCMALWMKPAALRRLFPLLLAVGVIAALSRSVVGAHWPLDIMVGSAIGWLCAIAATAFTTRVAPGDALLRWSGRFLALCALYLLLVHDTGYADARPVQHGFALFALCLVCLQQLSNESAAAEPG
jgi:membrane-associated phospholipid phosphatase